jgi:hypothetical protein
LNGVIHYLYNCRVSGEILRNDDESSENRGGEEGVEYTKKKKDKLNENKTENSKDLITTLMLNAVRAYVHGVCAVSLKATQALGDLHLVDKEEQGKKNKGNECLYSLVSILFFVNLTFGTF